MARLNQLNKVRVRKWKQDLGHVQMLMELSPSFSATVLALAAGVDRTTIYRNCSSIGTKRIDPPATAELLLEGLDETRIMMTESKEWPEDMMPKRVIEDLKLCMDLDLLNQYLYAVAGVLKMRPLHLRMFALELAVARRSVRRWYINHGFTEDGNAINH